jgi:biopolymer transport protein ExbD
MQIRGAKASINVTPLIDIVLVLLIIFMVITPMAQSGKDVELPKADAAEGDKAEQVEPLIITVDDQGRMWVDDAEVDEAGLRAATARRRAIVVRGDARARVGDVRRAMRALQAAGAQQVALAVEGDA